MGLIISQSPAPVRRLIIAGTRTRVVRMVEIDRALKAAGFAPCEIVCGGATGGDQAGKAWAFLAGVPVKMFPADWKANGRAAGPIRNTAMAKYADALIAFWDGQSRGTAHMIECMRALGKPVHVVR